MNKVAAEKLAEFHEKQSQRSEKGQIYKIWTLQGVGTEAIPTVPREDVLPFGFAASKPCFRFKTIGHLAIFRVVVCERECASIGKGLIFQKLPPSNRYSKS